MSNFNWPKNKLSSLTSGIGDGIHGTPVYIDESDYFFINGNNLKDGLIKVTAETKKVSASEFQKHFIKFDEKTLFLSINGTLGSLAKYRGESVILGKSAAYIKCSTINIDYLYYYLQLGSIQEYLWNVATGSTIKNLSLASIRNLEIPTPPDEVQSKIALVLSTIDEKIRCNNQIKEKLESMAKLLYDYWFIQHDFPDANGKPYKFSNGTMIHCDVVNREIPTDWKTSTLGDIEPNIVTGKTPSKNFPEYFDGDIPFITIGDIRDNTFIVSTEEFLSTKGAETQSGKFLPADSICVSCIASPGLVGFVTNKSQTNQQINSIICSSEFNKYYLYFSIKSYFDNAKAKTGNTFANMNKGDFSAINIVLPPTKILTEFHQMVMPMFETIKTKSLETKELIQLRDWLLPMLMNGQVTVT